MGTPSLDAIDFIQSAPAAASTERSDQEAVLGKGPMLGDEAITRTLQVDLQTPTLRQ